MKKIVLISNFLFAVLLLSGCEDDLTVRQDALTAYTVEVNGNWNLFSISRNGEDLSGMLNITDNSIALNNDGTFNLSSSTIPFPTLKTTGARFTSGNWTFNDDFQPTKIHFSNGSSIVPVKLDKPLYGKNNNTLSFKFSLGCGTNSYLYQFKKN